MDINIQTQKTKDNCNHHLRSGTMALKCKYCGLIVPSSKPNPEKWLHKHEMNCARNPNNNKTSGPIGTE